MICSACVQFDRKNIYLFKIHSLNRSFSTIPAKIMFKNITLIILSFITLSVFGLKDTSELNQKSYKNRGISLGTKRFGICFGNRENYSGLKFSIKNTSRVVNGLSASITSGDQNPVINGIDLGLVNFLGKMNGIQLSVIGVSIDEQSNGLFINPIVTDMWEGNGLAFSGIVFFCDKFSGFSFSGIYSTANRFNGVLISPGSNIIDSLLNGFSFSGLRTYAEHLNGFSFSAFNRVKEGKGVLLGLINHSDSFKGVQLGLWNIIKENRRPFRRLPIINCRFRKKQNR
jgi:hypothetical protein